jgi:predicted glutamine amidotransferase
VCELLGMSANVPTDICFSFTGLIQRGGRTGPHADGWGITFYEGDPDNNKGCRSFKDPAPSCDSKIAELVASYPIKSCAVVCHIRQANSGAVNLENTHPFTRELWGQNWTFAHNGQLENVESLDTGFYLPVGQTDSEQAFCWLLRQLRHRFPSAPENRQEVFQYIAELADYLNTLGVFNMLLTDGEYLMAYCSNNLYWITRRAPFGEASLKDDDVMIDFKQETTPNDVVTVIATDPLTCDETWQRINPGDYCLFRYGEKVERRC